MDTHILPVGTFFFILLTSGCGGGSSNGGSNFGSGSEGSSNVLRVGVQSQDICDVKTPQTDALLVLHDSDFNNVSVHAADEDGEISVPLDADAATFSVLSKSKGIGTPEALRINTYIDVPVTDIGLITQDYLDDDKCECRVIPVVINNSYETELGSNYTLNGQSYDSRFSNSSSQPLFRVQICRDVNGDWPLLTATAQYQEPLRTYSGSISAYEPVDYLDPDFEESDVIEIQINNDIEVADVQVQTAEDLYLKTASAYIGGVSHYAVSTSDESTPLFLVNDNMADFFRIEATAYNFFVNFGGYRGDFVFNTAVDIHAEIPTSTVDLELFDFDTFVSSSSAILEGADTYDFSDLVGAELVVFTSSVDSTNNYNRILRWSIHTDVAGSLSNIDNFSIDEIDYYVDNNETPTDDIVFEWHVHDYENANSFEENIEIYSSISRSNGTESEKYKLIVAGIILDEISILSRSRVKSLAERASSNSYNDHK